MLIWYHVMKDGCVCATHVGVGSGQARVHLPPKPLTPASTTESTAGLESKKKGVVDITPNRWVKSTCAGKNRWLADLKGEVLRWLDLSIVSFAHQHPGDWQQVVDNVGAKWTYVGHAEGVDVACLQSHAKVILKNERWRLHVVFQNGGENPRMPAPPLTDPTQWSKLVHHFLSVSGKNKSEKMTYARGNVQNPNLTGRKGNAGIVEQLVRTLECCTCFTFMSFYLH